MLGEPAIWCVLSMFEIIKATEWIGKWQPVEILAIYLKTVYVEIRQETKKARRKIVLIVNAKVGCFQQCFQMTSRIE